jgi:5-formyltetrahydrofolate cyclo-ligase
VPDFAREAEKSPTAKITLRSQLLTARKRLSAADHAAATVAVQAATADLVRRLQPSVAAGYVPIGAEPGGADLPEVLAGALPPGGRLLLPVLLPDADLDWAVYDGPASLAPGPRGLREPIGAPGGVDSPRHAELVIVPALAVGRDGTRMGRGGGSYDRALDRAQHAVVVALLHDGELLDAVPREPHDRQVHAVVTPTDGLVVLRPF